MLYRSLGYGFLLSPVAQKVATDGGRDYVVQTSYYGGAEQKGCRPTQEDRMRHLFLSPLQHRMLRLLQTTHRETLLHKMYADLNHQLAEKSFGERFGSTGITSLFDFRNDTIHFANLGDSQLIEVKIDTVRNLVDTVTRLNELHNPGTPTEKQRIERAGHRLVFSPRDPDNLRLATGLAVSRAFGDKRHMQFGLSHKPQIKTHAIDPEEGIQIYYIVACDGLTEADCVTLEDIGQYVLEHRHESESMIAEGLVKEAFSHDVDYGDSEDYSEDNISVQICRYSKEKDAFLLTVFDGHGTDKVAQFLADHWAQVFDKYLRNLCGLSNQSALQPLALGSAFSFILERMMGGWGSPIADGLFSLVVGASYSTLRFVQSEVQNEAVLEFLERHQTTEGDFEDLKEEEYFKLGQQSVHEYSGALNACTKPLLWSQTRELAAYYAGVKVAQDPELDLLKDFAAKCQI